MPKPITIAKIRFDTRKAALEHCQEVLYRDELGTQVLGKDAEFLRALLKARPDKVAEIGARKVVRLWRDVQPGPFEQTRCFYAELDDGTRLDFSFNTALNYIVEAQHPA